MAQREPVDSWTNSGNSFQEHSGSRKGDGVSHSSGMVLRWLREPNILAVILPSLLARMESIGEEMVGMERATLEEVLLVVFVCLCGLPFSILPNNSLSQTRPVTVVFSSFVRTVWSSHLPHLSVATLLVSKNLE